MKTIKQVESYGKKIIPLINLNHWEIYFRTSDDKVGKSAIAKIEYNYKYACIFFYDNFWSADEEFKKKTIIHELLHCHFSFYKIPIEELQDSPDQAYNEISNFKNIIIQLEEEPVELLARSIYKIIENATGTKKGLR